MELSSRHGRGPWRLRISHRISLPGSRARFCKGISPARSSCPQGNTTAARVSWASRSTSTCYRVRGHTHTRTQQPSPQAQLFPSRSYADWLCLARGFWSSRPPGPESKSCSAQLHVRCSLRHRAHGTPTAEPQVCAWWSELPGQHPGSCWLWERQCFSSPNWEVSIFAAQTKHILFIWGKIHTVVLTTWSFLLWLKSPPTSLY